VPNTGNAEIKVKGIWYQDSLALRFKMPGWTGCLGYLKNSPSLYCNLFHKTPCVIWLPTKAHLIPNFQMRNKVNPSHLRLSIINLSKFSVISLKPILSFFLSCDVSTEVPNTCLAADICLMFRTTAGQGNTFC